MRVRQVEAWSSPWAKLVHFARDRNDLRRAGRAGFEPAVLIVAPLSGHYASLLRGTVEAFLQDHEVYVTDWVNARQVPMLPDWAVVDLSTQPNSIWPGKIADSDFFDERWRLKASEERKSASAK